MLFIEYPRCTTCQKAKKWLDEHNIKYIDRDIKLQNPTSEELKQFVELSKKDLSKFFNTSGLLYKEFKLKDKLPNMSDEEKYELLASNGMLVKRPILVLDNDVLVGFKEKEWEILVK